MFKQKLSYDNIIIFLSFILCVFHTFTFCQLYYSFFITLGIFVIIVFLHLLKNKWKIKKSYSGSSHLCFLYLAVLFMIFFGVIKHSATVTQMCGKYLPILIWPTLYIIVAPIFSNTGRKKFIYLFLCTVTVSVIATLVVVFKDNDAARLLAGAASEQVRQSYYRLGVGGYGFVYGCVFLVYAMIMLISREKSFVLKILLFSLTILTCIMIVFASYTTALLMMLIEIILSFYAKSKKRGAIVIFVIAVGMIVLFLNPILEYIHKLAIDMDLYWISKRIGQLTDAADSGSVEGLSRTQLYLRSLATFLEHPIFGGTYIGGHSMVFDTLGEYGIFGIGFVLAVSGWILHLFREAKGRNGLIYLLLIVLLTINTIDQIVFIPILFFIFPIIISNCSECTF